MANPPIEWLEDSQQQMPASKHEDEEPAGKCRRDRRNSTDSLMQP